MRDWDHIILIQKDLNIYPGSNTDFTIATQSAGVVRMVRAACVVTLYQQHCGQELIILHQGGELEVFNISAIARNKTNRGMLR